MNKQELIKAVAEKSVVTRGRAEEVLAALSTVVIEGLSDDGEVVLPGIGKLKLSERAARTARNPKTGESVDVPAKTVVKLGVSKGLADAVGSPLGSATKALPSKPNRA